MTNKITIELDEKSVDELIDLIKEVSETHERMLETVEDISVEFKKQSARDTGSHFCSKNNDIFCAVHYLFSFY